MDNYKTAQLAAELEAQQLEPNETIYTTCPVCQGRKKFSVTRLSHSVVWNCFRASCPVKGHSHSGLLLPAEKPKPRNKLRPYTGKFHPLSGSQREFLLERFPLSKMPKGTVSSGDGRFIFPILNPSGYERGYLLRNWPEAQLSDWDGPKAMTHMHAEGPVMSWHRGDGPVEQLVLVEDMLSAYCAQQAGLSACALLGVNLDNDKVREIACQRPREVIIALDADATEQSFRLARKWGLAFQKTRVAVLERDLKDETDLFDIPEVLGI